MTWFRATDNVRPIGWATRALRVVFTHDNRCLVCGRRPRGGDVVWDRGLGSGQDREALGHLVEDHDRGLRRHEENPEAAADRNAHPVLTLSGSAELFDQLLKGLADDLDRHPVNAHPHGRSPLLRRVRSTAGLLAKVARPPHRGDR